MSSTPVESCSSQMPIPAPVTDLESQLCGYSIRSASTSDSIWLRATEAAFRAAEATYGTVVIALGAAISLSALGLTILDATNQNLSISRIFVDVCLIVFGAILCKYGFAMLKHAYRPADDLDVGRLPHPVLNEMREQRDVDVALPVIRDAAVPAVTDALLGRPDIYIEILPGAVVYGVNRTPVWSQVRLL